MPKITYQGKVYSIKTLKGLTTQGIRLRIPNEDLVSKSDAVEWTDLVVTPIGEQYAILLGKIDPTKPVQVVRMLSKVVLKKALYDSVYPPPVAQRTYSDATQADNRPYRPRRDYGNGDFSGGW